MFSWSKQEQQGGRLKEGEMYATVTEGLQTLYTKKLLPLEDTYLFHDFHSPALEAADFQSKPMVLLVGQYSTGKTTFIRYLLEQDFPGMRIGPEPTTDGFIAVMYGDNEGVIPGNALVVDPKKPFRKLNAFGNSFLNRFICSQMTNQVLESISIIDTPGILSGEKQYDLREVLAGFGERVDRINLLSTSQTDISDEFSGRSNVQRGQYDKIRWFLNKRRPVYRRVTAPSWSLGKVIRHFRSDLLHICIFISLFVPLSRRRLFERESQDLFRDIQSLPRNAALRKLNDLIKRARLAKVQAYIISYLKKEMPTLFGREKKKEELILRLPEIYAILQREHHISPGDFPNVAKMQDQLQHYDFSKFPSMKIKLIESVDKMLTTKIAVLMAMIQEEESKAPPANVQGGAFQGSQVFVHEGPFGYGYGEGISAGADHENWIVSRDKHRYDELFFSLMPVNGKISGVNAKKEMMNSRLPNTVLGKIWKLADCDNDGMLDDEEFALAQYLIQVKLEGYELPVQLPAHLVPPSYFLPTGSDIKEGNIP
uniref:EH domain containing 4 n=1 Tax=Neogobius melanostomus TaxID=47308 RepID=A0A8C6U0G5_9GOBI